MVHDRLYIAPINYPVPYKFDITGHPGSYLPVPTSNFSEQFSNFMSLEVKGEAVWKCVNTKPYKVN